MKNKKIILLLIILFSTQLIGSGGSVYSRYGIGDLYHSGSAYQLSLGGLGVSMSNPKYINTTNPATLSSLKNTRFGVSVLSNTSILDDGITNATYSHTQFSGFHIAFPIKETLGMGFVLGMEPYSTINYEVYNTVVTDVDDIINKEEFSGNGGLSKVYLGISYLLPGGIALGSTFNYYTGNVQYNSTYLYDGESDLVDSYFIDDFKYKGLGATFGLQSPDISELLSLTNISNFNFGLTYEIVGSLTTNNTVVARTSIGEKTVNSSEISTKLPSKLNAGFNFTVNEKYLLVFDYVYQPWSKYEQNDLTSPYLTDLTRYSLGFEYGANNKRFASFWELVRYRGGLSYEQSQYEINDERINQLGIHAGISFPLGTENTIDIGLMYGIRGTTDSNLLKENILKASFSLNFGELWFSRRDG